MNALKILEIAGVVLWIIYLLLAVNEKIACWIFGILASCITIYNFYHGKLYSEAIVNVYYVGAGIYGWYYWAKQKKASGTNNTPVSKWTVKKHFFTYSLTIVAALLWGSFMHKNTDSPRPYIDSFTACFSFLTTFMEARKILTTWINWFCINIVLVYLQVDRGLPVYAGLSALFAFMSIIGFIKWRRSYMSLQPN